MKAAEEVYDLEYFSGASSAEALSKAVEAAVSTAHRGFISGTRDDILEKAVDMDSTESDLLDDGVAALIWYAKLLDETLPPEQQIGGF